MHKQFFAYLNITLTMIFMNSSCNHMFYHPDSIRHSFPEQFPNKVEEIIIKTDDNESLELWKLHPKATSKESNVIVHFHGNAENLSSHVRYVSWLTNYGYYVVTFDYRGYGKSTGTPSRQGLVRDGKAVINWVRSHEAFKGKEIYFIGQSLGGAVLIPSLVEANLLSPSAVILDSTFSSYQSVAQKKLAGNFLTWIVQWPLPRLLLSHDYNPDDYIGKLRAPQLFIHGDNDPVVPVSESKRLFEFSKTTKKDIWIIEGAPHTWALHPDAGNTWKEKLLDYLCRTSSKFWNRTGKC